MIRVIGLREMEERGGSMGFLNKERTVDQLDSDLERVKLEEEINTHRANSVEREMVVKELKKKYGRDWMHILGVDKLTDISTLRSMLVGARKSMESMNKSSKPANFITDTSRLRSPGDTAIGKLCKEGVIKGVTKA